MNFLPQFSSADKLMIKTILVITAIAVMMILSSCSPARNITAWRCVDQYKVINGIGHDFVSLSGQYGYRRDFDKPVCKIGDTITIKKRGNVLLLSK